MELESREVPIIRTEQIRKDYVLGAETVFAVRGGGPHDRAGRVRRDHGTVRERKEHVHERDRLPGHSHRR